MIRAAIANAEWLRDWLIKKLITATDNDLTVINSVATDTCRTMFNVYDLLKATDKINHVIYAPCDSHGLQLLIKDILELPEFEPTMKLASKIMAYFSRAAKQYAILREHQIKEYGTSKALILAGIIRWGTQLDMIKRLIKTRQALRTYAASKYTSERKDKWILSTLLNDELWDRLELLLKLLNPIHYKQKISEGNNAHLGLVKARWDHIRAELCQLERDK